MQAVLFFFQPLTGRPRPTVVNVNVIVLAATGATARAQLHFWK